MVLPLAFSLQDHVEKYGAYVGLAAFIGLAVLSLLYFAQARELKRLRDWAGRAPERAQELEARVIAQADEARRVPAPAPAVERSGTVGPAQPVAPASGNGRQAGRPAPIPMGPRPAVAMAAAAARAAAAPATEVAPADDEEREAAPVGDVVPGGDDRPEGATLEDREVVAGGDHGPASTDGDRAAAADEDRAEAPAAPVDEDRPAAGDDVGVAAGHNRAAAADDGGVAADDDRAAAADDEAAAPEDEPVRAGNGVPTPPPRPVDIPRATPRPQPRPQPAPAAPLRAASTSRSATLPPRRRPAVGRPSEDGSKAGRITLFTLLGVIVLIAAVAVPVFLLGGSDEPAPRPNTPVEPGGGGSGGTGGGGGSSDQAAAAARPETVVTVLNGTPIEGLASQTRDKLIAEGYADEAGMIRTGNNTDQQRQDSVVLYADGERRQARDVASILGIDAMEAIDPDTQALADATDETGSGRHADVVVILGGDQSP